MSFSDYCKRFHKKAARRYIRIVAERSSEHRIALGAALGLFIGMLIPMSMQLIIVLPLAFAFRASKIAAAAFTFVTNPVSVVFIYPVQVAFGYRVMNFRALSSDDAQRIIQEIANIFSTESSWIELFTLTWWQDMLSKLWGMLCGTGLHEIILPFFVGGFLFGVALSIPGYFAMRALTRRYQKARHHRRTTRLQKQREKQLHNQESD